MRSYEVTFVFDDNDEVFKKSLDFIKEEFKKASCTIQKEEDLKVRDLLYPMKKRTKGHYYYFEIEASPDKIIEVEKNIRLNSDIIKHLFIKK